MKIPPITELLTRNEYNTMITNAIESVIADGLRELNEEDRNNKEIKKPISKIRKMAEIITTKLYGETYMKPETKTALKSALIKILLLGLPYFIEWLNKKSNEGKQG